MKREPKLDILKIGLMAMETCMAILLKTNCNDQNVSGEFTVNSAVLIQVILKVNEISGTGSAAYSSFSESFKNEYGAPFGDHTALRLVTLRLMAETNEH